MMSNLFSIKTLLLITIFIFSFPTAFTNKSPPPPPPVQALEKQFTAVMNETCARVMLKVPTFSSIDESNFMNAYTKFNGTGSETEVFGNATKLLSDPGVMEFLTLPDSFIPGELDGDMVLCAVLRDATPLNLAEFGVQGSEQLNLIYLLLNDTLLMRDMLVAGGPVENQYGPAMAIYSAINKSSLNLSHLRSRQDNSLSSNPWDDRNQSTVLLRLALATALAHAVPIPVAFISNGSTIDPVARYFHYEKYYLLGDLDPAFEVLTIFELMMVVDSNGVDEDLLWLRTTMGNYRPDYIAGPSYTWRYIQAVHQEVPYQDPQCPNLSVCNDRYPSIPIAGGECGPRAFFSRFSRKSYGLPTFGVTEHAHAAMSSWAPNNGWSIQLGSSWPFCWWLSRSGDDFILEAQARENYSNFQMILRGGWVANARDEIPVSQDWTPSNPQAYGKGGVWGALMLYAKKIAVNTTNPVPPRPIGPSVVPTKVATLIAAWSEKWPTPNITTDSNGTINIPAAAVSYVNRSAPVSIMKNFDLSGEQLVILNGNYVDPDATSFSYEISVQDAGTRYLIANFSTWHINIDLLLKVNNATDDQLITVPIYYTVGYWNQTQPVPIQLVAGKNTLKFMRSTQAVAPIAIREFFVYINEPHNIPMPPGNYTPTPPPPRPDNFIAVPPDTSCYKQGITNVPETFCQEACEALNFKFSGDKATVNMTDCFVLSSGSNAGTCLFNTNTTASICAEQPCTVDGSITQQICLRQ